MRLVSCADKLHNARGIVCALRRGGPEIWGEFRGGRDGTLWYYRSLVEEFRAAGAPPGLLEELARTVSEMERLAD